MTRTKWLQLSILVLILTASAFAAHAAQEQCYCNGQTQLCQWGCSSRTKTKQYFCVGDICVVLGEGGLQTVSVVLTPAPSKAEPTKATVRPTSTSTGQVVLKPTITPLPATTPKPTTDANYTPGSTGAQEQNSLNYINEDRIKNNLTELSMDPALQKLARMKSQDMADNNYFSHTSPTYGSASQMLKDAGYAFTSVGENIAHHASVYKAHAALMSSTNHRRNILGSQWTRIGIGIAYDKQGYPYITQLFAR